eukprot:2231959-Amphidinium_carterae.1
MTWPTGRKNVCMMFSSKVCAAQWAQTVQLPQLGTQTWSTHSDFEKEGPTTLSRRCSSGQTYDWSNRCGLHVTSHMGQAGSAFMPGSSGTGGAKCVGALHPGQTRLTLA